MNRFSGAYVNIKTPMDENSHTDSDGPVAPAIGPPRPRLEIDDRCDIGKEHIDNKNYRAARDQFDEIKRDYRRNYTNEYEEEEE